MEKINPKLIATFVRSIHNVFTTMVGVKPIVGKPSLKTQIQNPCDISGIVGFSGDVAGTVVISFKKETAESIVESFTGERMDMYTEDFIDAIGELSNMIAGNAKKDFNLDASIGIPSVILGSGHMVAQLRDVPCIVIPCRSEAGDIILEVNIKQNVKLSHTEESAHEISAGG